VTEVRNGSFKVVVRSQEFDHSGIRNFDVCVDDAASTHFPTDKAQCFLHGFDFVGLGAKWVDERNVDVSFACGRVSNFTNFVVVSDDGRLPVEFHGTPRDGCNRPDTPTPP
jgi:hypothetical protein